MSTPTFTRRQLGRRLRRLREKADLSVRAVEATQVIGSARTLTRLEQGHSVNVTYPIIGAMCDLYGTDSALKYELQRMYREADGDGWWEPFGKSAIKNFTLFVELEQYASEFRIYEPELITGLLQTEAYARDLHAREPELDEKTARESVELRMRRQKDFWTRSPMPRVQVLMGETALRSDLCDEEQRHLLAERAARDNVEIRVLPLADGPDPRFRGPFVVMYFDDPDDADVVYTETITGSRYEERASVAVAHREVFERAFAAAKPFKEM